MEPPSFYRRPDNPALITPSASPPPLRANVPPFLNRRGSSPPLKRQRMQSSTPSRATFDAPSSSSRTQTPVIDIQKEREASRLRLFDVWSSLAERYTRHLDEDDIVDLQTGKITRDNGVIRGSRPIAFGALAASASGYQTADEGSDEEDDEREDKDAEEDEEENDEYGLDELDAFANPEDYGLQTPDEGPTSIMLVPPPSLPFGPSDEADLEEFMNAERMRRDECGTDVEDAEEVDDEGTEGTDLDRDYLGLSEREYSSTPASDFVEDELEDDEDEVEEPAPPPSDDYFDHIVPLREDSDEDELADWKADDSNFTRPVSAPPEEVLPAHEDEVEFVETAVLPPKKPTHIKSVLGRLSPSKLALQKNTQLLTPPLSSSSYAFSATPEPIAHSSKSPFRSSSRIFGEQKKPARIVEVEKSPVKESRSTSSAKRATSKSREGSRSPTKPQAKISAELPEPPTPAELAKRPKPFVLLPMRNSVSPTKPTATTSRVSKDSRRVDDFGDVGSSPTKSSKAKGKERAKEVVASSPVKQAQPVSEPSRGSSSPIKRKTRHESPEPYVIQEELYRAPSSSSPVKKTTRTPAEEPREERPRASSSRSSVAPPPPQPRASSSRDVLRQSSSHNYDDGASAYVDSPHQEPASPPPTKSKKRKRVVSDMKAHSSDHEASVQRYDATEERRGRSRSSHRTSEPEPVPSSPQKRSTSQKRHFTPETDSEFGHGSSSPSASESPSKHQRHRSRSRARSQIPQYHVPPPPPTTSYENEQRYSAPQMHSYPHPHPHHLPHSHSHPQPHLPSQPHPRPRTHEYPPVHDPRAQLIIAQAMHQLSALVGGGWPQPYSESYLPQTPSHRHQLPQQHPHQYMQGSQLPLPPPGPYVTPTHRRPPEPYYDPSFSYATAPPDSPEVDSSPDKSSPPKRKSIVGRSRSRGRRVSFRLDEDDRTRQREALQDSSPTRPPPAKHNGKSTGGGSSRARKEYSSDEEHRSSSRRDGQSKGKGRGRADTPAHGYVSASDSGSDSEGGSEHHGEHEQERRYGSERGGMRQIHASQPEASFARGQTPGPEFEPRETASHAPSASSNRRQSSRSRR